MPSTTLTLSPSSMNSLAFLDLVNMSFCAMLTRSWTSFICDVFCFCFLRFFFMSYIIFSYDPILITGGVAAGATSIRSSSISDAIDLASESETTLLSMPSPVILTSLRPIISSLILWRGRTTFCFAFPLIPFPITVHLPCTCTSLR